MDGENLMSEIETANTTKTDDLAHGTYKHIKVPLSAMLINLRQTQRYL
jgi:hypothetical protein